MSLNGVQVVNTVHGRLHLFWSSTGSGRIWTSHGQGEGTRIQEQMPVLGQRRDQFPRASESPGSPRNDGDLFRKFHKKLNILQDPRDIALQLCV
ncbi:hypothetical protein EJ06DRAFT_267434 [Trichodelitschia bisporula]|uniref:Uncharacterized protein n=1 Tax=Trichodelitschia bisporula TaxID=703511 RepID=A0A6G1HIJ8_9PEZI|nr:hypothetical protein EJ06DRAFT_267434 [Trichodelitschia bisporula]